LTFNYNAGGQLSTVTTPIGTYNYTYDSAGRLSNLGESATGINLSYAYDGTLPLSTTWTGPVTGDVSRTYDNNFRVVSQSVNGANTVNYTYDNDGLLTNAGDLSLTRDADNGLLSATELGVVNDAWTYNTFGEPTNYTAKASGSDAYSATFTRDALGRITTKNETVGATSHLYVYTYDASGRLTTVQKDGATAATYTYDDNGNRTKKVASGVTTNGTYDAQDRLLTYGGTTYTYTPNGELKTKVNASGTTTYTYDVAGNLRNVVLPDGKTIEYFIDGECRRVGKKVNGTQAQGFLYTGRLKIAAELDGSNNIVSRFVYSLRSNVPDYMVKGGQTYRIIVDHLGSPRLVINTTDSAIAQRIDYDEFGNVLTDTNPGFIPFGFAGGLYDQDTKLARFGLRDYDPETSRWTAKDRIEFAGGDGNLYGYVYNDPINQKDARGLMTIGGISPIPVGPPIGPAADIGGIGKGHLGDKGRGRGIRHKGGPCDDEEIDDGTNSPPWDLTEEGDSGENDGNKFPPTDVTPTGDVDVEPSTKKGNKGGSSIQETFIDENGDPWTRHTVVDSNGKLVEAPHFRPGGPK
jgi:RHS repeat-associated protein